MTHASSLWGRYPPFLIGYAFPYFRIGISKCNGASPRAKNALARLFDSLKLASIFILMKVVGKVLAAFMANESL
jgi:hypothetical protein